MDEAFLPLPPLRSLSLAHSRHSEPLTLAQPGSGFNGAPPHLWRRTADKYPQMSCSREEPGSSISLLDECELVSRLIKSDRMPRVGNAPMKLLPYMAISFVALLFEATSASGEDNASTIPMTLTQSDYGGGRIYLPVRFGNVMGTMRLDTGASTSRITLAPWNEDLPSLGQSYSTGASGKTTRCDDVVANNVELKAARGNNIARSKYEVTRCAAERWRRPSRTGLFQGRSLHPGFRSS